jgi:hypothetical protein
MTPVEFSDRDLSELPLDEPPEALVRSVRGRAHRELARGAWRAVAVQVWSRFVVPAALATTVVGYLTWALGAARALYR